MGSEMILAALVLLLATALGAALLTLLDGELGLVERVAGGLVLGTALLTWVTFGIALVVGLAAWLVVLLALIGAAAGAVLLGRRGAHRAMLATLRDGGALRESASRERWPLVLLVGAFVLALLVYNGLVSVTPDGVITGIITDNWSSLPTSLGLIASFAWGGNLPPDNPVLAGVRLSYHFLTDFAAAMLVQLGLDLFTAVFAQTMLLVTATLVIVYAFARRVGGQPGAAVLAVGLVLAAGGLGFMYFFQDAAGRPGAWWEIFLGLPRQYTHMGPELIRWGAPLVNHAIPDRSLLYGIPLAVLAFHLGWVGVTGGGRLPLAAAGGLAGILPLFSVHAFLAVLAVAVPLAALFRMKAWAWFFGAAGVLALPELLWLAPAGMPILGDLADLLPWQAPATAWASLALTDLTWSGSLFNLVWWWFKNLGLFPVVLGFVLASRTLPRPARLFTASFLACVVVRLLFTLRPTDWEANRMLIFWLVGSAPLMAVFLVGLFGCGHGFHRLTTTAAIVSLLLSGALDLWRAATPGLVVLSEFDADGLALGRYLRGNTPAGAAVLAVAQHNSPVLLSGRPLVLGHLGFFYAWGLRNIDVRQREVATIFRGEADAPRLLAQHRIRYAVIGPAEVEHAKANVPFFEATLDKVADVGRYRVFRVR